MDTQDSAAVLGLLKVHPVLGAVASLLLGSTAGAQSMIDAVEQGATDEQALNEALLSVFYDILLDQTNLGTILKYVDSFLENMIE